MRRDAEESSGTPTPLRARPSLLPIAPVPTRPPRTAPGSDARSPLALPFPAPSQDKLIDATDVTHMFKITKVIGLCATGKLRACPSPSPPIDPARGVCPRWTTLNTKVSSRSNEIVSFPPTPS